MMHEGKKYPCDACDYFVTENGHLRMHKQSVHQQSVPEGKKPFSLLADVICEQSTFHDFFVCVLMVFQQLIAGTPHICACEAYATLN